MLKIKNFSLSPSQLEKMETIGDFLIKFNLLAIPMYAVILSEATLSPLQVLIADIIQKILVPMGYEIYRTGIVMVVSRSDFVSKIAFDMDCTAWKSMYALVALMMASPVENNRKKLKYMIAGVSVLFLLNIVRIVSTIVIGYNYGISYLNFAHTVLWREGMVLAVIAIWTLWFKNQKVIFSKKQTILRKLLSKVRIFG